MGKHIAQTVFNRYDRIMIDASSLMNYEALDLFFTRNGNGIRNSGRGILIPGSVQMEIARHIDSGKTDKVEKALGCIVVLANHPGLVVCSECDIPEELMYSTHADPEILAMLVSGKRHYRQLLITNDCDLAMDALELNSQRSCQGETISVKRINKIGELKSFKPNKQSADSTAPKWKALSAVSKEDAASSAKPVSPVQSSTPIQEPVWDQQIPATAEHTTAEKICPEPSSTGVPLPLFILGMIGMGILGALFGAAAAATSQTSEDSELAA